MVKSLLGLNRPVQVDAGDGLAIALCHAHHVDEDYADDWSTQWRPAGKKSAGYFGQRAGGRLRGRCTYVNVLRFASYRRAG